MRKIFIWILLGVLVIGVGVGAWLYNSLPEMPEWPEINPENAVSVHTIVIEEVKGLGKMELAQYTFSDVINHSIQVDYFPDPKVMLQVYGETVACVDFTKIDSSDIHISGDTLILDLPSPEICYSRIDHERSEIVETWYTSLYAEGQKVISQAFTISERKMQEAALQSDILGRAELEAQETLVPLLRNLTQKQVFLHFPNNREASLGLLARPVDTLNDLTILATPRQDTLKTPASVPNRPEVIRD